MKRTKMALVTVSALPEIFGKVLKAKELIASGVAKNASDAARICDISRSAFYKYKDSVFAYNEQHVINLRAELRDEAGILSAFLSELSHFDANVLTVNQGLPVDHVAAVTMSIRIDTEKTSPDDIIGKLKKLKGVVSVSVIR